MILVDTSVWIDYFNGVPGEQIDKLDAALDEGDVATGDLILLEVLQGFKNDKHYRTARQALETLDIYELLGYDMAIRSAENYRTLRKKGLTIRKTNDVVIATFCIENSIPLLFGDRDFSPFVYYLGLQSAMDVA